MQKTNMQLFLGATNYKLSRYLSHHLELISRLKHPRHQMYALCDLRNLKNMKKTNRGVLPLLKVKLLHWCFSCIFKLSE